MGVSPGLKFEPNAEIGENSHLRMDTSYLPLRVFLYILFDMDQQVGRFLWLEGVAFFAFRLG